jgi:hypothetical protein
MCPVVTGHRLKLFEFDAGDKTRVARGQQYGRFRNLIRATHASHRDAGDDLGHGLLRKQRQDRCIDRAGTNDVGADRIRKSRDKDR